MNRIFNNKKKRRTEISVDTFCVHQDKANKTTRQYIFAAFLWRL